MRATTVAFFNNKGGVGKTSLVYHLAWMFADMDVPVVAADLDPQANLTAAFLDDETIEALWEPNGGFATVYRALEPIVKGAGDIAAPVLVPIAADLHLLAGDLALSDFEDHIAEAWPQTLLGKEKQLRVTSAFWRILQAAAANVQAGLVLIDLGPNLGPLNRSALFAADWIVTPLAPDLFSLRGLTNLGPTVRKWSQEWEHCRERAVKEGVEFDLPTGDMQPAGYVVLQHSFRRDRPVRAYDKWIAKIPGTYHRDVLNDPSEGVSFTVETDPYSLGLLKHYRTLMALAHEARKPIFRLTAADGATGAHATAARAAAGDFQALAEAIAKRIAFPL